MIQINRTKYKILVFAQILIASGILFKLILTLLSETIPLIQLNIYTILNANLKILTTKAERVIIHT